MKIKDLATNGLFCDGDWIESKDQDPEGEIRLIQLADIGDGHFIDKSSRFMNLETATRLKCSYLSKNDILIARMPDPIGRACIFPFDESQKFVTVVDVALLRLGSDVSSKYVMYALNSTPIRNSIKGQVTGTTRQRITRKKIGELEIPLPPLEEQKKIAAILDAADDYRQKTKALIDMYDKLTQSLFLDMFGDPVTNPKGWEKQKVEDIATIIRGASPRPKGDPKYYGPGVPRLMVADLTRDGFYVTPKIDFLTTEGAKKSRPMQRGDLVMAVSGKPGATAILMEDCCIHDGFAGFKNIDGQYRAEFLCHYFHHFITQVTKVSAGAIFKNITTDDIRKIDLLKIPLESQDNFLMQQQSILKSKNLAEASLVKAEELFSSLLQRAFKGELTS